jgi:hypothetical protein
MPLIRFIIGILMKDIPMIKQVGEPKVFQFFSLYPNCFNRMRKIIDHIKTEIVN